MKLYDKNGSAWSFVKTKPPKLHSTHRGRLWENHSAKIDGVREIFNFEAGYGNWLYIHMQGQWYKCRMKYENDVFYVEEFFTQKETL